MRLLPVLVISAFALGPPGPAQGQSSTVLRCGRVIDGRADAPVADASIVVTGDRIKAIGASVAGPAGAREVDLRAMTCLPGLIDLHVHLRGTAERPLERSSADKALAILRNAQIMLQNGFTTVRDLGEPDAYYAPISVKNAIARG